MANFHELIEGFHNFREEYLLKETEFFEELKHGQNPHTLVIACCDSRVDPAIILGCRPGDLFVISGWVSLANPVIEEMRREEPDADPVTFMRRCEEAAVLLSIENLLSYHWLEEKVCEGSLNLHALYYDMAAGTLNLWDAKKEDFVESRLAT